MAYIWNNYSGICAIIGYGILFGLFMLLKPKKKEETEEEAKPVKDVANPLDINDEDALVASLIAAIECRNETNKNVRIVSIREIG